jgi:hypothetical protein
MKVWGNVAHSSYTIMSRITIKYVVVGYGKRYAMLKETNHIYNNNNNNKFKIQREILITYSHYGLQ